jgi:WD40 repeat protein/serine/threonine protein kinase/tetratricopeptide (TPR) repeat protein
MAQCPSRAQLALLLAEQLAAAEAGGLITHVQTCGPCQDALDELSAAAGLPDTGPGGTVQRHPDGFEPDADFLRRLREAGSGSTLRDGRGADDLPPLPRRDPWPEVAGYEILGELGRGGMGVVYKARHVKLGRVVALKVLLGGAFAGPQDRARFRAEAEAAARLQHPHIVQIFEVGEEKGCPYLALEYVDGGSLEQMAQGTPLPAQEAAELAQTLARAVHEAHRRGIIHRDLKPANILLSFSRDGAAERGEAARSAAPSRLNEAVPKITDFGLAKRLDAATVNTQSGTVLGTPDFMAPEQAAGSPGHVGPPADVYALGAILYYLLTGRPPFLAATPLDTLLRVRSEEPVPPSVLQPKVPRDLETICLKCLRKSAAQRYASAAELADDLGRFRAGEPVRARPTPVWERAAKWVKRRPALATLAAVSSLAAVALVVLLGAWWRDAEARARAVQQLDQAQQQLTDRKQQLARLEKGVAAKEKEAAWKRAEVVRLQKIIPAERARARAAGVDARRALYIRDMHLAQAALEKGRIDQLVPILKRHRPPPGEEDVRGFEWHYLWRVSQGERLALRGHTDFVRHVRLAPDGKTVASLSGDERVCLWDAATGAALAPPWGHLIGAVGITYSPDGNTFVTGHQDGRVHIWDTRTGRARASWQAHSGAVKSVVFSTDGAVLATGAHDGTAKLWDPATLRMQAVFPGMGGRVCAVALSPDKRTLGMIQDHFAKVWGVDTGRERFSLRLPDPTFFFDLVFSPDGKIVAISECQPHIGGTGYVRLRDPATGKELYPALPVPNGGACGLGFTPDGKILAIGENFGAVKFWDLATRRVRRTFFGNTDRVRSIAFTPDGKTMATGGLDKVVRLWDVVTPDPPPSLQEATGRESRVAFAPDGHTLAMLDNGGVLKLGDRDTGRQRVILTKHGAEANCLAFSPDSRTLATGSWDSTVKLWDVATGREQATLRGHAGRVVCVAFSPDGKTLASGSTSDGLRFWDLGTGKESFRAQDPTWRGVTCLAFAPGGKVLAWGGKYGTIRLWDLAARRVQTTLKATSGAGWDVTSLAFSPDGTLLAAGNWDGTVSLWDLAGIEKRRPLVGGSAIALGATPGGAGLLSAALLSGAAERGLITWFHDSPVTTVQLTSDGRTLVSGGGRSTIKLWDLPMLQQGFTFHGPPDGCLTLAFNRQGNLLASGGWGGTVHLWDVSTSHGREWSFVPNARSWKHDQAWHRGEADQAEKAGLWYAAAWHLDRLLRSDPRSAPLLARRARALLELGQAKRVVADLTVLVRQTPKDAELWLTRGRAHAQCGDWREALADYTQVLDRAPRDGAAWLYRSVAHARLGETEKAADAYRRAVRHAGVIRLKSGLSWYVRDRGPVRSGLAHWQAVAADLAKMAAGKGEGWVWRALREDLGVDFRPQASIKDAWWLWRARGLTHAALARWPEAADALAHAAEEKPDDFESCYALARAYVELGRWTDAAPACAHAVKLRPRDGAAWYLDGIVAQNRRAFDRAADSFSRAIAHGADGWAAWSNRAMAYAEMAQWDKASQDAATAARLPGAYFTAGHLRALVQFQLGDQRGYRQACADLLKALNKAGNPGLATWVADACALAPDARVDWAPVVHWLERGTAQFPSEPVYFHRLGQALYRSGRLEAAVRDLNQALRLRVPAEWAVEDWLFLAMAHHRLGHGAEARKWLARATAWADREVRDRPRWVAPLPWSVRLKVLTLEREAQALLQRPRP